MFRNVVTDFSADNTGNTDASTAIQNAIDAFTSGSSACASRAKNAYGTTGQPAISLSTPWNLSNGKIYTIASRDSLNG